MLYLTWVLARSIDNPRSFQNEFLIKKPYLVMTGIWAFGLSSWAIIIYSLGGIPEYTMAPVFIGLSQTLTNFFLWTCVDIALLVLSGYLIIRIQIKRIQSRKKNKNRYCCSHFLRLKYWFISLFKLRKGEALQAMNEKREALRKAKEAKAKERDIYWLVMLRFAVQAIVFLVQWITPSLLNVISPLVAVPVDVSNYIYWLTYTPCFTGLTFLQLYLINNFILKIITN
jgi:hypothetical protein